ncbi:unnamed protein product [Meloidogyne enterolobii]|uniref:Uncharacterized protein n=1 Tax=Meloidogyne enterolobii TaxID=390850 RepID=A0ACB1A179_MELEN
MKNALSGQSLVLTQFRILLLEFVLFVSRTRIRINLDLSLIRITPRVSILNLYPKKRKSAKILRTFFCGQFSCGQFFLRTFFADNFFDENVSLGTSRLGILPFLISKKFFYYSPSSPTPSISCETCTQLSQLEVEAFAAVGEVATFVKSISVSEILTRTPELLFLNLVTLENESYCIELTQKGWRICSDRLDCMYGDFRKLEMHINYYETIYSLLDSLSKLYRDQFSSSLASKLGKLQEERTSKMTERTTLTSEREEEKTDREEKSEDYDEDEVYMAHVRGEKLNVDEKPNIED